MSIYAKSSSINIYTEAIRRKVHGWGTLGALEEARRKRAETWERVRVAVENKEMGRREAQEERHKAALLVEGSWSGGYGKPVEMGGGIFVTVPLTPWAGWHKGAKE